MPTSPLQATPPGLRHLLTLEATLASPLDAGEGALGRRVLNAVSSGRFLGERLNGQVCPGTGDWMLTAGGMRFIDARLVLKCDDGALIHMSYGGRIWFDPGVMEQIADSRARHEVDPRRYYFRTVPVFETGHHSYRWLNGIVSVGVGRLIQGGVAYEIFEVS
ncbi:MAG: DUF3237 domain-containing protein [Phenylobacterium sp.]|uniref:DUF3237 domain-containing protein n=1 Tax=Phenylobacterium sp. TaxID=1871053 RepID=UPI00391C3C3A